METSNFVIIGAGLAGASTAWRLSAAGHEVTVVEQQERPAGTAGSSHGSARIFRYPYRSRFYVDLVARAAGAWDELESASGDHLLTRTGGVDFGARRDPRALAAVLESAGVDYELVPPDEAATRWPQYGIDTEALWQPDAGVIDSAAAVDAMLRLAVDAGARLLTSWEVDGVSRAARGYRVHGTAGGEIDCDRVVITAGGYLPPLLDTLGLPSGFRAALPTFEVRQEQVFHFPYRDGAPADSAVDPRPWPTFVHKGESIQTYGLLGGRDVEHAAHKVGQYKGGRVIPSARDRDGIVDDAARARIVDYARAHLPGVVPEPFAESTCLFTSTPDENFVFARCEGLTVVSPCSGHGAKFAPLVGELAAGAATAPSEAAARRLLPDPLHVVWGDGPGLPLSA